MQKSPAVAGLGGHARAGIEHIPPSTLLEPIPDALSSRYPTQGLLANRSSGDGIDLDGLGERSREIHNHVALPEVEIHGS